jgi:hypothetical protein
MLDKIDALCAERDRPKKKLPAPTKAGVLGGRNCRTEFDEIR